MSRSDFSAAFTALNRPSLNGYETSLCLEAVSRCYYDWIFCRYPTDPHNTEPTETLINLDHVVQNRRCFWKEAYPMIKAYLDAHPEDGFCFC